MRCCLYSLLNVARYMADSPPTSEISNKGVCHVMKITVAERNPDMEYLTQQLHSDFGDFNEGVCHVMKITIAERNSDIGH